MPNTEDSKTKSAFPLAAISLLAAGHLLLHLLTNGNYGMFRDEFYYLACADHPAWGYVDHPPLSIALLIVNRAIVGDSVEAIRILPGLVGVILLFMAAAIARELGGGRFAQLLAAVCVAIVPAYLAMTGTYSMNAFDLLIWALAAWLVVRIINTGDPRLWVAFGAVAGAGLMNKLSMLFFCAGLAVALPLGPLRRHLRSRYLWFGVALAFLIALPNIAWQAANGWPTREFIRNAALYKIAEHSPLEFFVTQIGMIHPANFFIWLGGLGWLLFSRRGKRYRTLGLIYIVVFAILVTRNSKAYYLVPAYTMLLAAGAVAIESSQLWRRWSWPRPALLALLMMVAVPVAPFVVPLLPVESFIRYQSLLGVTPDRAEKSELGDLPQFYADRLGWQEMTSAVAAVYDDLPSAEQAVAGIITGNYGEAGAINYFGRDHGLPPAICRHNSFYLWGPGELSGEILIAVGISREDLEEGFESVTPAGMVRSRYAMPFENDLTIYVVLGLKVPFEQVWRALKLYI